MKRPEPQTWYSVHITGAMVQPRRTKSRVRALWWQLVMQLRENWYLPDKRRPVVIVKRTYRFW